MRKKKYLPQICNQEIQSLIPNTEIYSRLNFGSLEPIRTISNEYHILYKTVCLTTRQVYVGIRTYKSYDDDTYIGCGVETKPYKELGISHFKRAVKVYGREDFIRQNLLFFSSREELALAERIIVDSEWVKSDKNLNICLGGGYPPRRPGVENGNYGNKWSTEKRKEASEYFKKNRDTSGGLNIKAVKCVVYDTNTKQIHNFECAKDMVKLTGLSYASILTWLFKPEILCSTIRKKRFILFTKEDYIHKVENNLINEYIQNTILRSKYAKSIKH